MKRQYGMILAKPCEPVAHSFCIAESARQYILPRGEMSDYAVQSDPTKKWSIIQSLQI